MWLLASAYHGHAVRICLEYYECARCSIVSIVACFPRRSGTRVSNTFERKSRYALLLYPLLPWMDKTPLGAWPLSVAASIVFFHVILFEPRV